MLWATLGGVGMLVRCLSSTVYLYAFQKLNLATKLIKYLVLSREGDALPGPLDSFSSFEVWFYLVLSDPEFCKQNLCQYSMPI